MYVSSTTSTSAQIPRHSSGRSPAGGGAPRGRPPAPPPQTPPPLKGKAVRAHVPHEGNRAAKEDEKTGRSRRRGRRSLATSRQARSHGATQQLDQPRSGAPALPDPTAALRGSPPPFCPSPNRGQWPLEVLVRGRRDFTHISATSRMTMVRPGLMRQATKTTRKAILVTETRHSQRHRPPPRAHRPPQRKALLAATAAPGTMPPPPPARRLPKWEPTRGKTRASNARPQRGPRMVGGEIPHCPIPRREVP